MLVFGGVINQNHISIIQINLLSNLVKLIQPTKTPLIQAVPLYKNSTAFPPPPPKPTALHSDETRPMAQFFSPASTFLGENTPKIDPMEA